MLEEQKRDDLKSQSNSSLMSNMNENDLFSQAAQVNNKVTNEDSENENNQVTFAKKIVNATSTRKRIKIFPQLKWLIK